MSLKLAWRNIWRNGRRTAITLTAAAMSTVLMIFFFGITYGWVIKFVRDITQVSVGEVQVRANGYGQDRSLYRTLPEPGKFLHKAAALGVEAAPRSFGFGLVSIGHKSAGASFWGVDPAAERRAFDLWRKTGAGEFLPDAPRRGMVLGKKLARSLNTSVGAEIVVLVQAADGSLGNELFTVTGVLQAVTEDIDRSAVLIHVRDFDALFSVPPQGMVHEIALNSKARLEPAVLAGLLADLVPGVEVRPWQQVLPSIASMLDMMDVSLGIMAFIFCLGAGLGVMNTMLMATHERIREFGVLKALGASPGRIMADILTEAALLGAVAVLLGMTAGLIVVEVFGRYPIDLRALSGESIAMMGLSVEMVMQTVHSVHYTALSMLLMWGTCLAAALYPAIRAARLDPVKAITNV